MKIKNTVHKSLEQHKEWFVSFYSLHNTEWILLLALLTNMVSILVKSITVIYMAYGYAIIVKVDVSLSCIQSSVPMPAQNGYH